MQDTDWIFKTSESSSTKAVFEATIDNTKSKKYSFHLKNKMNISIKNIVVPIAPTGISSTSKNFYGYSGTTQNPSSSTKINPSYSGMNVTLTSDSESNKYMRLILPTTLGDDFVGYQGYGKNTKIEWSIKNSTNGFSIGDNSIYNTNQLSDDEKQITTLIAKITKDKYTQNFELGITFQLNDKTKNVPKINDSQNNLFSTINVNNNYELEVYGENLPIEINSYIFSENDQNKANGWSIKSGSTSEKIVFQNNDYSSIKGKKISVNLANKKFSISSLFSFSVPNIEIPIGIDNTNNSFTAKEGKESNDINTELSTNHVKVDSWNLNVNTSNTDNKYIELLLPSTIRSWLKWSGTNNQIIKENEKIFWKLENNNVFDLDVNNLISVKENEVTTTYKLKNKKPLTNNEISSKLYGKIFVDTSRTKNSSPSNDNIAIIFDINVKFVNQKDDQKPIIDNVKQNLYSVKLKNESNYTDVVEIKINGQNLPVNNDNNQWIFKSSIDSGMEEDHKKPSKLEQYWKIDKDNSNSSSVTFVSNYINVYGKKFNVSLNEDPSISYEFLVIAPKIYNVEGVVGYMSDKKSDPNSIMTYYEEKAVAVIYGENLPLTFDAYGFYLLKDIKSENIPNSSNISIESIQIEIKGIWDKIWKLDLNNSSRERVVFDMEMLSARDKGYQKENNDDFFVYIQGSENSAFDFWFDREIIFSSKESLKNIEYYFSVIESKEIKTDKNTSIKSGHHGNKLITTIEEEDTENTFKVMIEPKIDDIVIGIDSTIVTTKNIKKNKISNH
ncbi:MAG: hypothetical protein HDR43_00365 [Mycoplasma sp.]|nr:hypothetical protein [Mycoplasma sp.]